MKVGIIGSRSISNIDIDKYIDKSINITTIISGGAIGVDSIAKKYAQDNNIEYIEFLPEYDKYGKGAPLKRNDKIIRESSIIFAFWDGKSKGTQYVINRCVRLRKPFRLHRIGYLESDLNLSSK